LWRGSVSGSRLDEVLGPDRSFNVPGAYTARGRETIHTAAAILKSFNELGEGLVMAERLDEYLENYDLAYLELWRQFVKNFLKVAGSWSPDTSSDMSLEANPFLGDRASSPQARALALLVANLQPYLGSDSAASWIKNIDLDNTISRYAALQESIDKKPQRLLTRVDSYRSAVNAIRSFMPSYYNRTDFLQRVYHAKPFLDSYGQNEAAIITLLRGQPDKAVELASIHFGGSTYGDVTQSPFTLARSAVEGFASQMYSEGDQVVEDLATEIRRANLSFLERLLVAKTARRLDELWTTEVVNAVRFLSDNDTNKALFGPGGLIVKFQTDRAAPFVESQGVLGYAARKWGDQSFPLTEDFFRLLTVGNDSMAAEPLLDSYNVTISAVAALVDSGAQEKPERTSVTLKGADSVQTLDILNYPISKVFAWKPGSSADALITITLPSVELYLSYEGPNGFPTLLSDILRGDLVLTPADFPDHHEQLSALGITQIRLMIQADGALPVIRHLNLNQQPLPHSIIKAVDVKQNP
jgi:hypothetical protein